VIQEEQLRTGRSSGVAGEAGNSVTLRDLRRDDWPEVLRIYEAGIATGNATFETAAPGWPQWDATHLPEHRLVAVADERVLGWIALSAYSDRCCYGGVGEVSVYVDPCAQGRGLGRALLERAIVSSEAAGIWTLQAGIFPENEASLALHKRCGFREVGTRERLGKLGGRWRDVVLLERRSPQL
jgi:phosphinothricin acetyltransferase